MQSPFVRPIAPQGYIDGLALNPSSVVIDAKMLVENWKAIFTAANGGLTFNSMMPTGLLRLSEIDNQAYLNSSYQVPSESGTHTHDGANSSLLGADAVGRNQLVGNYSSYGCFVSGTTNFRGALYFGSVEIPSVYPGDYADSAHFRIPFDPYLFGSSLISYLAATGRVKIVLSPRFEEETPSGNNLTMLQLTVVYQNDTGNAHLLRAFARAENFGSVAINHLHVDWVLSCLV